MCLSKAYNKVRRKKHLSDHSARSSETRMYFKVIVFNFLLEYDKRKLQGNLIGLKLDGADQILADAGLLERNINTVKEHINCN